MCIPGIVFAPWLPRLVRAFAQVGNPLLAKTARTPMEFVLVASIPIAAGTIMVAHVLIRVVYGASFQGAVPAMIVLAFCIPAIYVNMMLNWVLVAAKRQIVWTYVMVGAAIVNPLLNLVLIPATQARYHNGAIGAALSLLLTELLMDGAGFILVGRRVLDRASLRRCALAVIASAGMWTVAYGARTFGQPVALAAGVATLGILTLALHILTPQEAALVRSAFARLRAALARRRPSTE
jgi:O-antigen/teichoic acid export membrane protein